jgi:1-acyl-sn-glycerol-3-phosphate acyltransferase
MNRLGIPYFPQRLPDRLLAFALAALVPLVLAFLLAHILWGLLVAGLLFRLLPGRACDALVQFWSRIALAALGVRLEYPVGDEGRAPGAASGAASGALLLINHVSWVDIFVVCALVPARFVAKSEIGSWPLAGWLAKAVGTVFIERGRRHAVAQVNREVAERLRAGQSIGVFPEGTTTDGTQILRFHSNLVQAAVLAQAPVIPVALQYWQDETPSRAAAYIGEMNLVESMLRVLIAPRLRVRLQFLPAIAVQGATRQCVAQQARHAIGLALALPEHDLPEATQGIEIDALQTTSTGG